MSNHKYFPTKELYDIWLRENTKAIILDIVALEKGVYIDYIQFSKKIKTKRYRPW